MSEAVQIALIATIVPSIVGIAGVVIAWFSRKDIKEVRHNTNSMNERMVASAKKEGHAKGVKDEKERTK